VRDATSGLQNIVAIQSDLLLMGGSKSQKFLKAALDHLQIILPGVKRKEFSGLGHIAADNSEHPDIIAKELKQFFC
jgi:hypothetical protein